MSLATLTTLISNRLQRLSELFSANRAPSGYRPGVTLEYVRRNLGLASFTSTGPAQARFCLDDIGLQVDKPLAFVRVLEIDRCMNRQAEQLRRLVHR